MEIPVKMNVPVRSLGLIVGLLLATASFAQTTFIVSGTFSDNSSTPFAGIVSINTQTGAIEGFNFSIPTMTLGATTLPGANFTPSTATANFFSSNAPPCSPSQGGYMTFQLLNAPPNSEELYLLIPQSSLISYSGGALLQQVTCGAQTFHTGYQSGPQSNPFIEISGNGSITIPQLQASGSVKIPVNPLATFLATSANDTSAVPATSISLASLNIHPGDTIILTALGDVSFCFPSCGEVRIPLDGLFSTTNSPSGAIAAAGNPIPFVTPPTLFGGIPTDIPQDFRIPRAPNYTAVTVPAGAQFLFLIMVDTFYSDNADPNNDLAVLITSPSGPVYVSVSDSGQVIKVDPNTGAISVVLASGAGEPEGMAIGPDGKIYICDSQNGRIRRMNQDGSQLEVIYDFSTTTSTTCGGAACPDSVDGPSFILSNGDLFFNSVAGGDYPGPFSGTWKIPGVAAIGFGGPFPVPINTIPASQLSGMQEGEGTAFDLSGNLLIADASTNRVFVSPPPYTSASVLIPDTMGVNPVGLAVNSRGDILVANLFNNANVDCFSSSGAFQTTYADFSETNDLVLFIQFDNAGNLFVITLSFSEAAPPDGRLWRVSPAASPPCSAPGVLTLVADIGAAFSSSSVPGLNGSGTIGVAIPHLSAPPTPLTSGGQPITGTPITVFSSPAAVEQVTFPPGTVIPPGETMQATASTLTTADFQNTRTAGSVFFEQNPNTKCIVYPATPSTSNGTCFVFEDKCFDANGNPTTCPTSPQPNIIVSTTINNLPTTPSALEPLPTNPGFLTADDNQNDWVNIFLDMYVFLSTPAAAPAVAAGRADAIRPMSATARPLSLAPTVSATLSDPALGDPTVIRGGTTGFNSDFVAVDIGPDPLVGAGAFQGFQPPLAPKNAHVFTRGTTIPVKFQVVSANDASQFITNATAKLTVVLQGNPPVQEVAGAANKKGTDAQFVYNFTSNSYQYYLSTVGYPAGTYTLTVFSNSFPAQVVTFTLQ